MARTAKPQRNGKVLRAQDIPRVAERVIIHNLLWDLERASYNDLKEYHLRRRRLWQIERAVRYFHLRGKPANAQEVAKFLDVPRGSAIGWLDKLIEIGIVARSGTRYFITTPILKRAVASSPNPGRSMTDRQIAMIHAASDALRAIKKK